MWNAINTGIMVPMKQTVKSPAWHQTDLDQLFDSNISDNLPIYSIGGRISRVGSGYSSSTLYYVTFIAGNFVWESQLY